MKRNNSGQFQAEPTASDYARRRRLGNVAAILLERGYGDQDACYLKAAEMVNYAFQAAAVEHRNVDEVLRSCLKHLAVQS